MKKELMEILVCPVCKRKLALDVTTEEKGEIISGTLACAACNNVYRIEDGIPDLLPPEKSSS